MSTSKRYGVGGWDFDHFPKAHMFRVLLMVMVISLILIGSFEMARYRISSGVALLQSPITTVVFGGLVATLLAFVAIGLFLRGNRYLEALRKSEENHRALFERMPIGLYRTAPDGKILEINPFLVEMLKYPDREALMAVNANDVYVNPEDRQRQQALLDKEAVVENFVMELRRYDGTTIWVEDTVRAVRDADGNMLYSEGSLEDVTETKRMEQYLLRTERLAAMGNIMATLAHEVKNPLQAIQSNLELLLDYPLEPDESNNCLQVCRQEVERLIEITQRMLSFSRAERHTVHPVSIPAIWQQTMVLLNQPLEKAAIQVSTDFPGDLPQVLGVADQLAQVLLNLVLNAVDVMPKGGSLHVRAAPQEDTLVLTLTNYGPPIPEEQIEHIFEPFFTTKPDGFGLGLFISHDIIQQHSGTLSVENLESGGGVSFTITLPIAPWQSDSSIHENPSRDMDAGLHFVKRDLTNDRTHR